MKKKLSHSKFKLLFIIIVFVFLILGLVIIKTNQSNKKISSGKIKTINPQTELTAPPSSSKGSTVKNPVSNNNKNPVSISQTSSSNVLIAPFGEFVSNHKPGQNGSNFTEVSQCNTTPGATCYIQFTQNNTVMTLNQQVVGNSGTVFWEWNVKSSNLSSGKWTITAISKLNGQTKSTVDQMSLEIL